MLNFEAFVQRHGESPLQQLVENWERHNNIRHERPMLLEDRWAYFIQCTNSVTSVAA